MRLAKRLGQSLLILAALFVVFLAWAWWYYRPTIEYGWWSR
jgi:hypothetical protein